MATVKKMASSLADGNENFFGSMNGIVFLNENGLSVWDSVAT